MSGMLLNSCCCCFFFVCVCVNLWHSSLTTNLHACCLDPRSIKMFVLDEADEMLSRGFKDQIYDIFRKLPTSVQVWWLCWWVYVNIWPWFLVLFILFGYCVSVYCHSLQFLTPVRFLLGKKKMKITMNLSILNEAILHVSGYFAFCNNACWCAGGDKKVYAGSNTNPCKERGVNPWRYQAVLHPCGTRGRCKV